ncbi:MAG: hypothetical protein K0Q49_2537, partial [Haloplasmataceae bacterium]|nr:hypothetical protein [Haloplasmataceae bacterium]
QINSLIVRKMTMTTTITITIHNNINIRSEELYQI